jgi:rubrerythrin
VWLVISFPILDKLVIRSTIERVSFQEVVMADENGKMKRVWSVKEILKMWPQANEELRGFQRALEATAGLTAAQLGMALQLAEAEFQNLRGQSDYRSVCCNAAVKVEGMPDFIGSAEVYTTHYVCQKCGYPCDVSSKPQSDGDSSGSFPKN